MAEYIEREAAIKKTQELKRYAWAPPNRAEYHSTLDMDDVLFGLHYLPAADVVEVVHGRWVDRYGGKYANPVYECSECKGKALYKIEIDVLGKEWVVQALSATCPNCGARMDGDE